MLLTHRLRGGELVAKTHLERLQKRRWHIALVDFRDEVGEGRGRVHGLVLGVFLGGAQCNTGLFCGPVVPPAPTPVQRTLGDGMVVWGLGADSCTWGDTEVAPGPGRPIWTPAVMPKQVADTSRMLRASGLRRKMRRFGIMEAVCRSGTGSHSNPVTATRPALLPGVASLTICRALATHPCGV